MACAFVAGGVFTFFVSEFLRRRPKASLRCIAIASLFGQGLTGLSLYLASPPMYYFTNILFVGPSSVCGMTVGVTYIIREFNAMGMRKGLASGLVGPIIGATTISWMWCFYFYLTVVQVGTLADGVGRIDLLYYGWAGFLFAVQMISASCMHPTPAALVAGPSLARQQQNLPSACIPPLPSSPGPLSPQESSKTCLGQVDLMKGSGAKTFWGFFLVYFVNLLPGMGLKLLSGPIAQFSYSFNVWEQTVFTNVYLILYALGRLVSPMLCSGTLQVRKFYFWYSLVSAAFLLATPGSVLGFTSSTWPSPLLFSFLITAQGFFTGGFKGLQPTMLSSLWTWMGSDEAFSHYDPAPAFAISVGMTNMALCFAGGIGPVTAYCAYVAPEPPGALLLGGATYEYGYQVWFYLASAAQAFAGCLMYIPRLGVEKYTPRPPPYATTSYPASEAPPT